MFEVKVTVDLGEKTVALLSGIATVAAVSNQPLAQKAAPEMPKEAPKAVKAPKAEKPGFEDLDDDAKLETIKAEVTKHTKKGKSADIKFLLSNFDAGRASELAPEAYDAFMEAITRYGKGESVTDIFPGDLD